MDVERDQLVPPKRSDEDALAKAGPEAEDAGSVEEPVGSREKELESGPVEGTSGRGVPQTVPRARPLDVPGGWLIQLPPDGVTLRIYG